MKKDERVKRKRGDWRGNVTERMVLVCVLDAKQARFLAKVLSLPETGRTQIQPGFLKILESIESRTSK